MRRLCAGWLGEGKAREVSGGGKRKRYEIREDADPAFARGDDGLIDIVSAAAAGEPLPLGGRESREEVLAEASAELARRLGTWELTAQEREEIESQG